MMTLIMGGSGSGKSAFAEQYIVDKAKEGNKYYIATMKIWGEEGEKKVEKHRMQRAGKGFQTIESPTDIEQVMMRITGVHTSVLLECLSNLVANEMFSKEIPEKKEIVAQKILRGIENLRDHVEHLVIVTNNVFEDGVVYDDMSMEYIATLGEINQQLAQMAENVVEVVVGIPISWKGEK